MAQRWRDAVGELRDLQGAYRSWSYSLPANVADSATAEALRAICEIDLTEPNSVEPPRGFGRDSFKLRYVTLLNVFKGGK